MNYITCPTGNITSEFQPVKACLGQLSREPWVSHHLRQATQTLGGGTAQHGAAVSQHTLWNQQKIKPKPLEKLGRLAPSNYF